MTDNYFKTGKLFNDYYKKDEYHKCRFCNIDIRHKVKKKVAERAELADGTWIEAVYSESLEPNALFAHGEIPKRDGSKFTFNGCIACVSKVTTKDFMKICKNDANMVHYMYRSDTRPKLVKSKVKVRDIKELSKDMLKPAIGR